MKSLLSVLLLVGSLEAYQTQFCDTACGWWFSGDYVLAWRQKRDYPPLVTSSLSGTAQGNAGVLGLSTTLIEYGGGKIGNSPQSGLRADLGFWLTRNLGLGANLIHLGTEKTGFSMWSNSSGSPIIARPFFNVQTVAQAAELIAYPNVNTNGGVDISMTNRIWEVDLYGLTHLFKARCLIADLIGGFTYLQLIDNLDIQTQTTAAATITARSDHFHCRNNFYAGCIGIQSELISRFILLSARAKVGIGIDVARTNILGSSFVGGTMTQGGLLALPTNIGPHSRRTFTYVPTLDARMRIHPRGHFYIQFGYDLIYWPKVALSGEQIDFNINTSQQEGGALTGTRAPTFHLNNKKFWAQGVTGGFYIAY